MTQERVQKILSRNGVASRRKAEILIQNGRVTVNGQTCILGMTANEATDQIRVDGVLLGTRPEKVYIMLNKPRGYVTTLSDEKGRKTVTDLVDCEQRVYPVGRLDMDSEGLLLLTNDGDLTNHLTHPSGEMQKTYEVWLRGANPGRIRAMSCPMEIDGFRIRPAQIACFWCRGTEAKIMVTIHEGRNRQIRKMAEHCGMYVTRLRRVSEGGLELGELPVGSWRFLTENEIKALVKL